MEGDTTTGTTRQAPVALTVERQSCKLRVAGSIPCQGPHINLY